MYGNHFRICHIQDAITFATVDDAVISHVETFISTKLKSVLEKKEAALTDCRKINKYDFYGNMYADDPTQFKFEVGDIAHIKTTQMFAKTQIETHKLGPRCFEPVRGGSMDKWSSYEGTVFYEKFGRFFTSSGEASTSCELVDIDVSEEKSSLYDNIRKLLIDRGVEDTTLCRFNEEMVKVIQDQDITVGIVECVLCSTKIRIAATVKKDKNYWISSNFGKHLAREHQKCPTKQIRRRNSRRSKDITANGKKISMKKRSGKNAMVDKPKIRSGDESIDEVEPIDEVDEVEESSGNK